MPAELAKELECVNINKNISADEMEIIIDTKDNDNSATKKAKVIVMETEKAPKGKKERMIRTGKDGMDHEVGDLPEVARMKGNNPNNNKASLGVMIDDTDNGVIISDLMDDSAAVAAGLRRGDVLLKVNDTYIFTGNGLISALRPYNPGDKVKIKYIRDGKEKSTTAVLKARN